MPALKRNLTIEAGSTWSDSLGVRTTPEVGPAWTVRAQVRKSATDSKGPARVELGRQQRRGRDCYLPGRPAPRLCPLGPGCGVERLDLDARRYDVELVAPDGVTVLRVAGGSVKVVPEVTR